MGGYTTLSAVSWRAAFRLYPPATLTRADPADTVAPVSEPASPPRPSAARATGDGSHSHRPAGYLLAAGAATSWGAQTIVAKLLLTSGLPATSLVSIRTTMAAIVLAAATALLRPELLRVSARDLWRIWRSSGSPACPSRTTRTTSRSP